MHFVQILVKWLFLLSTTTIFNWFKIYARGYFYS